MISLQNFLHSKKITSYSGRAGPADRDLVRDRRETGPGKAARRVISDMRPGADRDTAAMGNGPPRKAAARAAGEKSAASNAGPNPGKRPGGRPALTRNISNQGRGR